MREIVKFYAFDFFQDQFDVIDFSENDIRKLDGFPYFVRLKVLLLHNNRIRYEKNMHFSNEKGGDGCEFHVQSRN